MTTKPDQDKIYISLLGLAEHFRSTTPPDIKKCIQCLQALFTFMPPTKVVARTHLQMGQVLLDYTQSLELARHHLEQAVRQMLHFLQIIAVQMRNEMRSLISAKCVCLFNCSGYYRKAFRTLMMWNSMRPVWWLDCTKSRTKVLWQSKYFAKHYNYHSIMSIGIVDFCSS